MTDDRMYKLQTGQIKPTKTDLLWFQKTCGSDTNIATRFGVCPRTILNWRKKLGIPSFYFKNEKRNMDILAKWKRGWNFERIAAKVGLSESHVRMIIRKGG